MINPKCLDKIKTRNSINRNHHATFTQPISLLLYNTRLLKKLQRNKDDFITLHNLLLILLQETLANKVKKQEKAIEIDKLRCKSSFFC